MEYRSEAVSERSAFDEVIARYKQNVDRALLREALNLSPSQRVAEMIELSQFVEELAATPRVERDRR